MECMMSAIKSISVTSEYESNERLSNLKIIGQKIIFWYENILILSQLTNI